jgi:hypothetical protein
MNTDTAQVETFPFTVCSHTDYWQDLTKDEAIEAAKKTCRKSSRLLPGTRHRG